MINEEELLKLNEFIHKDYDKLDYHMAHIKLVKDYMILLAERLGGPVDINQITTIALSHDLLKEHGLDPDKKVEYNGIEIPQNVDHFVRSQMEILEKFGLDDYFNSDAQYHALAAGIFLYKELGIEDINILYPVMFHSCPILDVYNTLPKGLQEIIDITMLADKLSSNWLRINMLNKEVKCDLDLAVFGESGKEFNYTLGLYLARLITKSKQKGQQSRITNTYYYSRLERVNPLIAENINIGGKQIWPKRNHVSLMQL